LPRGLLDHALEAVVAERPLLVHMLSNADDVVIRNPFLQPYAVGLA
jgi:hypothetical protein